MVIIRTMAAVDECRRSLPGMGHDFFDDVVPLYEPLSDGRADNCYISKSFDATSHFETTSLDVIDMYERITGEKLDLDKMAASAPDEDGY